jgi:hypothetical protein
MSKDIEITKSDFWTRTVKINGIYFGRIECTKEERPKYIATNDDREVIGTYKTWKAATEALLALAD